MSREIKFRAYDNKLNVLAYDFDQSLVEHYPKRLTIGESINSLIMDIGMVYGTLQQYTGLKDVNGVEIYEGDILESGAYTCNLTVIYDEALAGFYIQDKDGYLEMLCDFANSSEVIGNIHQDPELLK